jgi:D-glycero-alpha-D-manno-heptose-7-phosphate kinase
MIIARSPLRISLGGGGTDLPSYYERFGGFLIAGAIDKYVYVTLHQTFEPGLVLRYSKMERVDSRDKVEHPIIRESLKYLDVRDPNLEIVSLADIPAGTGLGSSGSFTTAMLKALAMGRNIFPSTPVRAKMGIKTTTMMNCPKPADCRISRVAWVTVS